MNTQPQNTSPSSNRKQVLWFIGLIPFVVMHNISAVFIELRGVVPGQLGLAALGYFLGLASSALLLPVFAHNIAKGGSSSKAWNCLLLVVLLFPGFFSLILPFLSESPYRGNTFINTFQPFLWALFLPVAFQLFFHPILNGLHGVLFGIVAAVGHLCWALLLPIISISAANTIAFPGNTDNLFLPFLNTIRCIFGFAFALIAWWLISNPGTRKTECTGSHNHLALLIGPFLLTLAVCFFFYGMMRSVLTEQLALHEVNLGYMHLGLALLFLFIGFWVTHRTTNILSKLIAFAFLGLATAPALLYFFPSSPLSHVLRYAYVTSYQILLFSGTLVCGYFTLQSTHKLLSVALILCVLSSSILGSVLGKALSPVLPFSPLVFVYLCTAVHIMLAPLVRKLYLLLQLTPLDHAESGTDFMRYDPEMIHYFSKMHKLKSREIQIMEMLLQGLSTLEMVEILGLKENTIRTYIQTLLKKTGVTSRLGLVAAFLGSTKDASQ